MKELMRTRKAHQKVVSFRATKKAKRARHPRTRDCRPIRLRLLADLVEKVGKKERNMPAIPSAGAQSPPISGVLAPRTQNGPHLNLVSQAQSWDRRGRYKSGANLCRHAPANTGFPRYQSRQYDIDVRCVRETPESMLPARTSQVRLAQTMRRLSVCSSKSCLLSLRNV